MAYSLLGKFRGGFLGREISVNISRITAFTTPESSAKRGLFLFPSSEGQGVGKTNKTPYIFYASAMLIDNHLSLLFVTVMHTQFIIQTYPPDVP